MRILNTFFSKLPGLRKPAGEAPQPGVPPVPEVPEAEETSSPRARPDVRTGERLPILTDFHVPIFGQPDAEGSYYHGHIDGAFDGDAETFISYITACRAENEAREVLEESEQRRDQTRQQLGAARDAQAAVNASQSALALHREEESKALEEFESARRQVAEAEVEWRQARHRGSFVSIVLYGLAGVVFLAGDFVVSKAVVSQALKLDGKWEPLLFAAGIAALAFLIKIAYERLVERPYGEGKERVFKTVILTAAALTLVTLALLGTLRAQELGRQRLAAEQAATTSISLDFDFDSETSSRAAEPAAYQVRPLDVAAFVATAILFAFAGAICFGVAVVSWDDFRGIRLPAARRLGDAQQEFSQTRTAYQGLAARRADFERAQALEAHRFRSYEGVDALHNRLTELESNLPALRTAYHDAHRTVLEFAYRSGFTLARNNLAEVPLGMPLDEHYAFGRGGNRGDGAASARSNGRRDSGARHGHRRPFLDLRDDILDFPN